MGFLDKIKQLFAGSAHEEPLAPLMKELGEGQRQLFLEYEQRRERLEFAEATAALQSLLVKDDNEIHQDFYRNLIEEMKIYLSSPEYTPKTTTGTWKVPDNLSSEPDMQGHDDVMDYSFRGKGKIGYRWKKKDE